MLYGNILRFGKCGKVHYLVRFNKHSVISIKLFKLQWRKVKPALPAASSSIFINSLIILLPAALYFQNNHQDIYISR